MKIIKRISQLLIHEINHENTLYKNQTKIEDKMNIAEKIINIEYEDLENLELPLDIPFELTVTLNNTKYEFYIHLKRNSNKLVALGSGLIPVDYMKRFENKPFYTRWTWNYNESFLCYNDPSRYLNEKIRGGWGVGTEEEYYLENIKNIILKICDKLNILNENILFYGSSMRGFMSLMLATMVKQSTALADIPQFNLIHLEDHWEDFKKFSFKNRDDKYIIENYGHRLNFIEMMKKEKYVPNALLVLNYTQPDDIKKQYLQFFSEELCEVPFNEVSNNLKIIINGKNKGHEPLSIKDSIYLVNALLNKHEIINHIKEYSSYTQKESDNLLKYQTARIDIKNIGGENNSIDIVKISDKNAKIDYPDWFTDNFGQGMTIHSTAGNLYLQIKCHNPGELMMRFIGPDIRDNNQNRIPVYINYTNIYINEQNFNDSEKIVWHDNPLIFKKQVKNSEIVKIAVKWKAF